MLFFYIPPPAPSARVWLNVCAHTRIIYTTNEYYVHVCNYRQVEAVLGFCGGKGTRRWGRFIVSGSYNVRIYICVCVCVQVSGTTCRAGPLVGLKNLCPRTLFPFPTSSLRRIFNMYLVLYAGLQQCALRTRRGVAKPSVSPHRIACPVRTYTGINTYNPTRR